MSVTQIDIDDDALDHVMALSQARTKKEAVNLALRFYAEKQERAARIARHDAAMVAAMRREWDELEPLDIDAAHARHIENAQRLGFRGTTASHLSGTGAQVLAERRGQAGTAGREPGQDA